MSVDLTPFSYYFVLLINFYMFIRVRNNFLFFCVFFILFFCNYSIIYANFINYIEDITFTKILSPEVTIISHNVLVLFNLVLFIFIHWIKIEPKTPYIGLSNKSTQNEIVLYFLYFLLAFIFIYGFQKPDDVGGRGSPSPAYEYSIILFILFFYYCGESKLHKYGGLLFLLVYSMQNFVFGGRIIGLQFLQCAFIIHYMHKVKMKYVYIGLGVLFFLFSLIGQVRGAILTGNFSIENLFSLLAERGFALDTAYSAYYTSTTFVYILSNYTDGEIFNFFIEFLKSIFLGTKDEYLLTSMSRDMIYQQGGGIIPFFFYFYLGIFGVVLSAYLVSYYLNMGERVSKLNTGFKKCLIIYVFSTTFRWYLYTPLILLRGVFFLFLAYYGLYIFNKLTKPYLRRSFKKRI